MRNIELKGVLKNMALPVVHPVKKTAQELRRSLDRIDIYIQTKAEPIEAEQVKILRDRLTKAYDAVPEQYRD